MSPALVLLWICSGGFAAAASPETEITDQTKSDGTWRIEADQLQWAADGRFSGRGVWMSPCTCEDAPWALVAEEVEGELGQELVLRGAALEVCGKRLLPIPRSSISLRRRRARALMPELGHFGEGWRVAQPVFLPIGSSTDLKLAPEWRSGAAPSSGARMLADGVVRTKSGPDVRLMGAVGTGLEDLKSRGMLDGRGALELGNTQLSMDSTWISDPRYLADFGADYLSRAAPWTESLLSAGAGPVRVESDTFGRTRVEGEALAQRPVAGVLRLAGHGLGPLSVDMGSRVDVVSSPGLDQAQRFEAAVGVLGGRALGPTSVEARAEARSIYWSGSTPWHEGRLWGAARLNMWGDLLGTRHLADVGIEASASRQQGAVEQRLPEDRPAPVWSIGPSLRSHWLSSTAVPLTLEARLPWTPDGLVPEASGQLQISRWGWRLGLSEPLQEARTWWSDERLTLGVGAVRFDELVQAQTDLSWALPGDAYRWRPGWHALQDLQGGRSLSQGPSLSYESGCDCLALQARASWSEDKELPELWVHLDLR